LNYVTAQRAPRRAGWRLRAGPPGSGMVNDLALEEGKAVRVIIKASEVLLGVD
jgi:hypothetical protein